MDTTALDIEQDYRRVIEARFVTKPDKVTPLHCTTCDAVLVMGQAAAAVTEAGAWHSYCADCASTPAAQIRHLFARVTALGAEVPAATQDVIRTFLTAQGAAATQPFIRAKRDLLGLLASTEREVRVTALLDVEEYVGLALFVQHCGPKDKGFATSLLTQWEDKGSLSPKQMTYVCKFSVRGFDMAQAAEPDPDIEPSLYIDATGGVYRVYRRSHRLLCRTYNGVTFTNAPMGVRTVAKGLADGTIRLLTGDEARAYGRQHNRCFNCLAMGRPGELSDDRSIAAGYGERCASRHGWHYPTAEEAAAILRP